MNLPEPRLEIKRTDTYSAPLEGRRGFLRLDFNENTIGPSPKVVDAINKISRDQIAIYPEYKDLKTAIKDNLNFSNKKKQLDIAEIGIFNGVDAAIYATFNAYAERGDYFLTTNPTFGYYKPCALMQGMRIIEVPYIEKNFEFPFNKISEHLIINKPKIFFICNPNNPTGTRLSPEKIVDLSIKSPKTLIVVDELYEAFTGDSLLPIIDFEKTPNLLVLRSLSKTSGLAGLRIGFAIGNKKIIHNISKVTGPYDVNSFAVTAAIAALEDQDYINEYVNEVLLAKKWLKKQLEINNVKHHIEGGNYLLIWPKNEAEKIEYLLKKEGILIRRMKNKYMISESFRLSIGTTEQMKYFWETYKKIDII